MGSFQERIRADARITILQILAKDWGHSHNHEILALAVDDMTAITLTDSEIKEHLAWLENRGLIKTEIVNHYVKAKLTEEGLKVAEGRERVAGISRPKSGQV